MRYLYIIIGLVLTYTKKIAFDSFDTAIVLMSALFCSLAGMMSYPFGYNAVKVMSPRP